MASTARTSLRARLGVLLAGSLVVTALTAATAAASGPSPSIGPPPGGINNRLAGAVVLTALAVTGPVPAPAAAAPPAEPTAAAPASTRFHAFLRERGRTVRFDIPGATTKTIAGGSNNRGQIVGTAYADPAAPAARGFLLAKGVTGPFTPVDVPGAATTMVFGIDDHGRIVGGYQNPDATPSPQPAATPMGRTA